MAYVKLCWGCTSQTPAHNPDSSRRFGHMSIMFAGFIDDDDDDKNPAWSNPDPRVQDQLEGDSIHLALHDTQPIVKTAVV
eukprot:6462489-Amphidinium_carterae.2